MMAAHQQLQFTTAANQPSAIVTASVGTYTTHLQPAVTLANSASPASATPAHFANPGPASIATSASPATGDATPVHHLTGYGPTTLHPSACPAATANTLRFMISANFLPEQLPTQTPSMHGQSSSCSPTATNL